MKKYGDQFEFPIGRMVAVTDDDGENHTYMLHLTQEQASLLVSAMDNLEHEYGLDDQGEELYLALVELTSAGETIQ